MRRIWLLIVLLLPLFVHAGEPDVNLLIQAAEGGIPEAQYDLAVLYERGEGGVKQNMQKARHWYEAAAKNGHAGAQAWLAEDAERTKRLAEEKRQRAARAQQRRRAAAQAKEAAKEKHKAGAGDRSSGEPLQPEMIRFTSFALGKHEVTFDEYDFYARSTGKPLPADEGWGRGSRPVINVSWKDAVAYADWLSRQTGKRYRLPTEEEWNEACGNRSFLSALSLQPKTCGDGNMDELAWYSDNSGSQTHPVGQKKPNSKGLYDMTGNVSEWTSDCSVKVENECRLHTYLGGSWLDSVGDFARSVYRYFSTSVQKGNTIGFRLAQDL